MGLTHELKPVIGNIGGGDEFDHEDLYTKYKVSDFRIFKFLKKKGVSQGVYMHKLDFV